MFREATQEVLLGKDIVFICSPSAAILDMWLPVLHDLRRKLPRSEFVCLVPSARQVGVLDLRSTLFFNSNEIFDSVVCPSVAGRWQKFKSLVEAQEAHESEALVQVWRKFKNYGLVEKLKTLISFVMRIEIMGRKIRKKLPKQNELTKVFDREPIVLLNIFELAKPYLSEVEELIRPLAKFSIYHGIRFESAKRDDVGEDDAFEQENTTALLFSAREIQTYRDKFGLDERDLHVIGIPRHQKEWLQFLESVDKVHEEKIPSRFILVISRPSDDHPTFSRATKLSSLRNVKAVAEKYGLKVVIKLHPKEEIDDGTAEEVFGSNHLGVTWMYSRRHPLALGKRCEFAVTFLSSVAVDLSRIGIPVIEHLDLTSESSALETQKTIQNQDLRSIFSMLGFAISANNRNEFEHQVAKVMNCREDVAKQALQAYEDIFPIFDGIIETISDKIIAAVD